MRRQLRLLASQGWDMVQVADRFQIAGRTVRILSNVGDMQ